jgi:hypothetical protein
VRRGIPLIAFGSFVLAFSVRLAWIFKVQSPFDSIYSDMSGYVDRAERLLWNLPIADPRMLTFYPPGTHGLLALEFYLLGRHSRTAISIVHALVGAVPAACAPALTARLVPSRSAAALVGVIVALWQPQIWCVGFFSSEIWFSAAIAVQAWLAVRDWKGAYGLLGTGLASITAFVIRPQFLLTWAMTTSARAAVLAWRRGVRVAARNVTWLALPVALGLVVTSVRYHRLSGHWGLISASGLNRIWADTDICKVEASWTAPNGDEINYWFSPPSKPALKASDAVTFTGFIVDPDILDPIRRERMRGVSWRARIARKLGNVELLLSGNLPWPESNYKDRIPLLGTTRSRLQQVFRNVALYEVLPLSLVGLALGRRNRTTLILGANLATIVIAAAFFFGEARYHVPYDPFALVLAAAGIYELGVRGRAWVQQARGSRTNVAQE